MIVTTTRTIQNTAIIKEKIQCCLKIYGCKDIDIDETLFPDFKSTLEDDLEEDYVSLDTLRNIKKFWNLYSKEKKLYIYELINNNELYLPKYEPHKKSEEYEVKIQSLRAKLDEEAYQRMVYNVDLNSPLRNFSGENKKTAMVPEFKTMQGQLVAIFNIIVVVGGAFVFGYKAVEYSMDQPDVTKQIFGGFILALIVAIADIYFLIKKLLDLEKPKPKSKAAKLHKFKLVEPDEMKQNLDMKSKTEKKND